MSDVEDIKSLQDVSSQSSWVLVSEADTRSKSLSSSTKSIADLSDTGEKKEESDSDSISIISESDDSKEGVIEKEVTEEEPVENQVDHVRKLNVLYSRLYAFACLLLAVVLPLLLNYVMHHANNNPPGILDIIAEIEMLSKNEAKNSDPSRTNLEDSNPDLVNVNIVTDKEFLSYFKPNEEEQEEIKIEEVENYPIDIKTKEIKGEPSGCKRSPDKIKTRGDGTYDKQKPRIWEKDKSRKDKPDKYLKDKSDKHLKDKYLRDKSEKYLKDKLERFSTDSKSSKKNKRHFSNTNKDNESRENREPDKFKAGTCGKELSKLRRVIVDQEKHIRELNRSLKERERQIKIIQQRILKEIKELKHMQTENSKYRNNFTETITGDWYDGYFDHRDKVRKRKHEADWFFDRASYRQKKRITDKNWYINWMLQREDYRKRSGFHFSF